MGYCFHRRLSVCLTVGRKTQKVTGAFGKFVAYEVRAREIIGSYLEYVFKNIFYRIYMYTVSHKNKSL